eukprot:TRINITY_DN25135_c0_g1_i1.p2 TRINITY_DN25135_c0_g1~~TRINITY_DN25135_c0_g1_i1.p2  ORF type:complete len:214 (+),score=82.16 TRINITY_DN25135_c0_g1_i1:1229-1870(+)
MEAFSNRLGVHVSSNNRSVEESLSIIGTIGKESSELYDSLEAFAETSLESSKSVVYEGSQESALIKLKQGALLEGLEKDISLIGPAAEGISKESKEFVSRLQDDSNRGYVNFERELRKKSETSSEYLKALHHDSQDVRALTLSSQKDLESRLEAQQEEDAKLTQQLQSDMEGQCNALKYFGDSYGKNLLDLGHSTNQKILEDRRKAESGEGKT